MREKPGIIFYSTIKTAVMKKLSFWASKHPVKARKAILLLHIILILLASYTGLGLYELDIPVPIWLVYATACLFFTAIFLYPERRAPMPDSNRRRRYAIRKTCDTALAACSFIFVCFAVNNSAAFRTAHIVLTAQALTNASGETKPAAQQILAELVYRDKHTLTRSEKRILKHEFNHQLKLYAKAKLMRDEEAGGRAILIILSIIGAVGLTFLLGGLVCNLSCNGSEAAAILLGIIGLAGIIFLLVLAIKKISSPHKKERPAPETGKAAG